MYQKHFLTFESFLEVAKKYEDYFHQCIECRMIRLVQSIPEETKKFLQPCLEELRSWAPVKCELESNGLFISHGACKCCTRERIMQVVRRNQSRQGFYQCFGQAVHGHCTEDGTNGRKKCDYYSSCVVTQAEIYEWEVWRKEHPKREWNTRSQEQEVIVAVGSVMKELSHQEELYYGSFVG